MVRPRARPRRERQRDAEAGVDHGEQRDDHRRAEDRDQDERDDHARRDGPDRVDRHERAGFGAGVPGIVGQQRRGGREAETEHDRHRQHDEDRGDGERLEGGDRRSRSEGLGPTATPTSPTITSAATRPGRPPGGGRDR